MIARGKGKATGYTDFYKASGSRATSVSPGEGKNWQLSINFGQEPRGFQDNPYKKKDEPEDQLDARKRAIRRRLSRARTK